MARIFIEIDECSVEMKFSALVYNTADIAEQLTIALQSLGLDPDSVAKLMLEDEDNGTTKEVQ